MRDTKSNKIAYFCRTNMCPSLMNSSENVIFHVSFVIMSSTFPARGILEDTFICIIILIVWEHKFFTVIASLREQYNQNQSGTSLGRWIEIRSMEERSRCFVELLQFTKSPSAVCNYVNSNFCQPLRIIFGVLVDFRWMGESHRNQMSVKLISEKLWNYLYVFLRLILPDS
jgi:hypothetical protein